MATITRTLTPEQATAIRHFILTSEYPNAAEAVTRSMPDDDSLQGLLGAREPISTLEAALTQLGLEELITEPVEVSADEDNLRDWAVGCFEWARSDLGQERKDRQLRNTLDADRRALATMDTVLPLIESLEAPCGKAA